MSELTQCEECGDTFERAGYSTRKYCSSECRGKPARKAQEEALRKHRETLKECEACGEEFHPTNYVHKFCSDECADQQKSPARVTRQQVGYVYVARSVKQPDRLKIGASRTPERRVQQLDVDTELVRAVQTFDRYAAEQELHGRFSEHHVGGEWFEDLDVDRVKWAMVEVAREEQDVGGRKEPGVFGTRDVAERLGCSPQDVREAIRRDQIPAHKWSGRYYILPKDLPDTIPVTDEA